MTRVESRLEVQDAAPVPTGRRMLNRTRPADTVAATPFRGVQWSITFAALLLYIVAIVSYRIPYAQVIMMVALIGLVFETNFRMPAFLAAFGALVVLAFMSGTTSPWPSVVREGAFELGKLWLIAFVAVVSLRSRARIRVFMLVFLGVYALFPVRGTLINYFVSGYTVFGRAVWNFIYSNSNDLGALTLLQLSLVAAFVAAEPRGWWRRAAQSGFVVLPVIILLTQSRGAFLGLIVFAIAAGAVQRRRLRLIGYAFLLAVMAGLIVPAAAWDRLGMVRTIGSGGTEVLEELDDQGSADQRYQIWQTAFRIIQDQPLQGVGWRAYRHANQLYSPDLGARDAHSTFLTLAAEMGIPGLMIFGLIIALVVIRAERVRRRARLVAPVCAQQIRLLVVGLASFLTAGIFGTYGHLTFLYVHLTIIWAVTEVTAVDLSGATVRSASVQLKGAR
jgi:O-antigen ligase